MKILLVEDEPSVAAFLHRGLSEQGYAVDLAADGLLGLHRAQSTRYDCLILDQLLPGLSGLEVCRQVRALDPHVPILMLTALGETDDKIRGLDAGADDYLVKPFAFAELLARLRALVRRRAEAPAPAAPLRLADLTLDPAAKRVERAGQAVQLTAREFSLLEYLLRHQGRVVSRADLLEHVWELSFDTGSNVIDVYINFLRKKVDKGFEPKLIHTLVGMGYVMKIDWLLVLGCWCPVLVIASATEWSAAMTKTKHQQPSAASTYQPMSIRLRLALQFGSILVVTLLLFALVIYFATQQARRTLFTQSLFQRTLVVGHAYADGQADRADTSRQASYRRYLRQLYRTLPAEVGRVYDGAGRLVFREGQDVARPVPPAWLAEVRRAGRAVLEPETDYHETVGLLYHDARLGPLVVVASSEDEDSRQQLGQLRRLLAAGLLAAVAALGAGSWVFAGQALRPLRLMVQEVDGITATDLGQRLTLAPGAADEIGRLAQRFNRLLDRLEAAFAGQRTFVRDASHELRTPLTALIGELEVALLQAERPPAAYRRVLQRTLDSARQLNELTNGLLQIARASDDPSQVPMGPVRLDELLLQAHEQLLRRHPTCRVDLDFGDDADAGPWAVRGNEALLLAAVLNVLDNACKFSGPGGGAVTAALGRVGPHLALRVADRGPGLSAADLQQVFVPFFRGAAARAVPGHGIGLPLAARIMALHGGTVRVESTPGHGTLVWLEWPPAAV